MDLFIPLSLLLLALGSCMAKECDPFECPKPTGLFADPCTCRRYYTCTDNRSFRGFCPSGLHWDDVVKECRFKNEAVCGPLSDEERERLKRPEKKEEVIENRAERCDPDNCDLPFCYCSRKGESAPADPTNLPQFILITIDGAVNSNNFDLFTDLLHANDSVTRATFFIEHEYCDYYQVEQLYAAGHEMALSSVSGDLLHNTNASVWRSELVSLREILQKYANVHPEDILGVRAPGIKPGYNSQYNVLVEEGFIWDSSIATNPLKVPVWPYTLDYRIPHHCKFDSCPTKSFPGLWEIPLNSHYVEDKTGGQCSYLDQCVFTHQTSDDVFEWIKEDFMRHYTSNKAPYMIPLHTNWFLQDHQYNGLNKFIQWTKEQKKNDVFYGTITELLLWMTEPIESNKLPSKLDLSRSPACNNPTTCELPHVEKNGIQTIRYMRTCATCPHRYPWVKSVEDADESS